MKTSRLSPASAREALALIEQGVNLRALRVCLFMAAAPGEWTQRGLCKALKMSQPDVSLALGELMRWELVTSKRPAVESGHAVTLYRVVP